LEGAHAARGSVSEREAVTPLEIALRCPLRIGDGEKAGCCEWDTFLLGYTEAWPKWFDAPPSPQQWQMAKRDWMAGNTGWEAAHNAQRRVKDRVVKREHEAWASAGAAITGARSGRRVTKGGV
jgi:hypothetical protein